MLYAIICKGETKKHVFHMSGIWLECSDFFLRVEAGHVLSMFLFLKKSEPQCLINMVHTKKRVRYL